MNSAKLELLDIFSYSCMNCLRSLNYIKKLGSKYKRYGLRTAIVHVPEWDFEKNKDNISMAIKKYGINFKNIVDKNKKLIKNLKINFWPAQILIKNNKIIYKHIGEGNYKALENKIMNVLKAKTMVLFNNEPEYTKFHAIYAGKRKEGIILELKDKLKFGVIYKKGSWKQNDESLVGKGSLTIRTKGKIISMVASSINKKTINSKIIINNKNIRNLKINKPRLYEIIKLKDNKPKILSIETKSKLGIYSFAFR
ncbi:MAG: hypothetical protein AABX34_05270 [Nanoarchaeota archaeon]